MSFCWRADRWRQLPAPLTSQQVLSPHHTLCIDISLFWRNHANSTPKLNKKAARCARARCNLSSNRETLQKVQFVRSGTLRLATNQARVDEFKLYTARDYYREGDVCRTTLIDSAAVQKLCPHLAADKVLAALYTTGDGFIDAAALCRAYAVGARKLGAHVVVSEMKLTQTSSMVYRRAAARWALTEQQTADGQSTPTWAKS